MNKKFAAAMLPVTALPFSKVYAHSGSVHHAPVNGYLYFMLSIGVVYFIFLLIRMQRKSNKLK